MSTIGGGGMEKIKAAMRAIPVKKDTLREALDSVQSYSSSLANFAFQWKDLEEHFAAIEKSFDERFKALHDHIEGNGDGNGVGDEEDELEPEKKPPEDAAMTSASLHLDAPPPDLLSLCANMDAEGLRSYINDNHNYFVDIREELAPAIRCAPDPALLVLDAVEGFYPIYNPNHSSYSKEKGEDGKPRMNIKKCITLLEKLHLISPNISPSVRDKARKLASAWESKIPQSVDSALETICLLQLIASYNLLCDFPLNTVLDLLISVSRRKQAVDLIKSLRLTDKLPDLIQKLKRKGGQLEAVKFVYAFNIVDKFPPVPLLKAYVDESKVGQKKNEATAGALKAVLKAVEEYKLEAEYPREDLVAQLEQKKTGGKKRSAASAAALNPKHQQHQQHQQSNKRPSPSSTSAAEIASNTYPPLARTHHQLGLVDCAPSMGVSWPYGPAATGSVYNLGRPNLSGSAVGHGALYSPPMYSRAPTGTLYNHGAPHLSGGAMNHGAIHSPPRSYYSSESIVGTSNMYDRPGTYNGYPLSGLPPSYGSSRYP